MHTHDLDYDNFRSTDDEYISRMVMKLAHEAKTRSRHKNRHLDLEVDFDVDDEPDSLRKIQSAQRRYCRLSKHARADDD